MQVDILEHDKENAKIKIKFLYKNIELVQTYDLKLVIPSTNVALTKLNVVYTEEMQQTIIDRIVLQVKNEIDNGILLTANSNESVL